MDKSPRFAFFSGGVIGIYNREYSSVKYVETKQIQPERKSWEDNFSNLRKFAKDNDRLPGSTGNEVEVKLYRFMSNQIHEGIRKSDDSDNYLKISELIAQFNYKRRKHHSITELKEGYSELKEFVQQNQRLPSGQKEDEKILYGFFYRQRKLFFEERLSIESKEIFLEIANLLNH